MHNSSLVAIAQYFWPIRTSVLYGNHKKINTEAVNDYPPIRCEIRFERKFPIVGLYFLTLPVETVKSVPRGKAIWNANGGFVSVLLTHLFYYFLRFYSFPFNGVVISIHYCVLLHHSDFDCRPTNVCSIFLIWLFWEINMDGWMDCYT